MVPGSFRRPMPTGHDCGRRPGPTVSVTMERVRLGIAPGYHEIIATAFAA